MTSKDFSLASFFIFEVHWAADVEREYPASRFTSL